MSTYLLEPVVIGHLLCYIPSVFTNRTRQVTRWQIKEEALNSANERPLPPTEAYCTVHSSCRLHEDGVENAGDPSAKLYKPALRNEQ